MIEGGTIIRGEANRAIARVAIISNIALWKC